MEKPENFTSRPTQVEAMQWSGYNRHAVDGWLGEGAKKVAPNGIQIWVEANQAWLTLEPKEWIIKDQLGFYPCKDTVFRKKYARDSAV